MPAPLEAALPGAGQQVGVTIEDQGEILFCLVEVIFDAW
jgi:hypothetical protein